MGPGQLMAAGDAKNSAGTRLLSLFSPLLSHLKVLLKVLKVLKI